MPILNIRTIPDPVLKEVAREVDTITPEVLKLVEDMLCTMRHFPRCVGLAAPQVGKSIRIVVMDISAYPKPHPNHGQLVLINPMITKREGSKTGREGCLSVPDFTANVSRSDKVTVNYSDPSGKICSLDSQGFEAVALQHEIDHLDGILFLDRVTSLKTDVFRRKG